MNIEKHKPTALKHYFTDLGFTVANRWFHYSSESRFIW